VAREEQEFYCCGGIADRDRAMALGVLVRAHCPGEEVRSRLALGFNLSFAKTSSHSIDDGRALATGQGAFGGVSITG